MKSYEQALEALKAKAIDFIDACEYALASARNGYKTSESLFRGKDLSRIFGGLER